MSFYKSLQIYKVLFNKPSFLILFILISAKEAGIWFPISRKYIVTQKDGIPT